jgi:bifunctional DNA-binding transcriptional regulator/antitoxin component of YhaV-PrlF toxin-antitoxin module
MNRVLVEKGFRLTLPKELRDDMQEGEEFIVTVDSAGRIVLLSEKRIRAALQRTAGIWEGRTDVPADGVKYVNRLRRGRRLRRLGVTRRATHGH